jgi:hypothetical protein
MAIRIEKDTHSPNTRMDLRSDVIAEQVHLHEPLLRGLCRRQRAGGWQMQPLSHYRAERAAGLPLERRDRASKYFPCPSRAHIPKHNQMTHAFSSVFVSYQHAFLHVFVLFVWVTAGQHDHQRGNLVPGYTECTLTRLLARYCVHRSGWFITVGHTDLLCCGVLCSALLWCAVLSRRRE